MVEQLASETFAHYNTQGLHDLQSFTAVDAAKFAPRTLIRTWFHQGQIQDAEGTWPESGTGSTLWPDDPPL
jgi:hypothetical protein